MRYHQTMSENKGHSDSSDKAGDTTKFLDDAGANSSPAPEAKVVEPAAAGSNLPIPPPAGNPPDGTLGLILAIVGILFVGILCVPALIIANGDKSYYDKRNLSVPGEITAAIIISWVGVAILIIVAIFLLFIFSIILAF